MMILMLILGAVYFLGVLFMIFVSFMGAGEPFDWVRIFLWPVFFLMVRFWSA